MRVSSRRILTKYRVVALPPAVMALARRGFLLVKGYIKEISQGNRISSVSRCFSSATTVQQPYERRELERQEVDMFDRDGFLVLTDFLNPTEKSRIVEWGNEIQGWPETAGKWFSYYETINGKKTLCRTENFFPYHDGMRTLIETRLANAISDLFNEPACLFKEKVNYKQPNGGAFPPHQDAPAYVTFNQRLHLTAMIAIDPMTKENGCLDVVAGRHKEGVIPQDESGNIQPRLVEKMTWQPIECDAGTVMFFNAFAPHRSDKNKTDKARRIFYLTFNAIADGGYKRDAYYIDKRVMFPPEIERVPGRDYSEGAKVYNLATPITNKKTT